MIYGTLCYADIQPAPKHFEREQRVELPLPGTFTLDQLVGLGPYACNVWEA